MPTTHETPPLLVSVPEACRLLGIGRTKLYEIIQDDPLASVSIGRRRLVCMSSIEGLAGGSRAATVRPIQKTG